MTLEDFLQRYQYNPKKDQIGEGGFGAVYKAYDIIRKRYVAIKESKVSKHKFTLQREVELAREIKPMDNLVYYENVYRFEMGRMEVDYATMEYFPEGNLDQVLQKFHLNKAEKEEIILGILKGVAYLHNNQIIHRDLKAGNILMERKGGEWIPKIADLGLSRITSADFSMSNSSVGISYAYAAPEQIQNGKIKPNVDLWAVGVIIYKIVTGELPFQATNPSDERSSQLELSQKVVNLELPDKLKDIEVPFQTLISKCLTDSNYRVEYAETLIEILRENEEESNREQGAFEVTEIYEKPDFKLPSSPPHVRKNNREVINIPSKKPQNKVLVVTAFLAVIFLVFVAAKTLPISSLDFSNLDISRFFKTENTYPLSLAYIMGKFHYTRHPKFKKIAKKYTDGKRDLYLREEAYQAFMLMQKAAQKDGVELKIVSAARDFYTQKIIWEEKWNGKRLHEDKENLKQTTPNYKKRALKILKWSSMPGTSRSHWGTEIGLSELNNEFFEKGEGRRIYNWLVLNAPNYGFCQPYTKKNYQRPYGYNEAKWQWSYLPIAKQLTEFAKSNLTDRMIKGFKGAETAVEIDVVEKFILGLNTECI